MQEQEAGADDVGSAAGQGTGADSGTGTRHRAGANKNRGDKDENKEAGGKKGQTVATVA